MVSVCLANNGKMTENWGIALHVKTTADTVNLLMSMVKKYGYACC